MEQTFHALGTPGGCSTSVENNKITGVVITIHNCGNRISRVW